jgi:16S rRNA (cytidine1402-2'-O)-methyltransferase
MGFLSRKKQKRQHQMEAVRKEKRTVVVYESPNRIKPLLKELIAAGCNRSGMLAREMTKMHEEFIRGDLSDILALLEEKDEVRGECTLLVSGGSEEPVSMDDIRHEITVLLQKTKVSASDLAKILAAKHKISKKILYEEILKVER